VPQGVLVSLVSEKSVRSYSATHSICTWLQLQLKCRRSLGYQNRCLWWLGWLLTCDFSKVLTELGPALAVQNSVSESVVEPFDQISLCEHQVKTGLQLTNLGGEQTTKAVIHLYVV
jgi:hypothetical protein